MLICHTLPQKTIKPNIYIIKSLCVFATKFFEKQDILRINFSGTKHLFFPSDESEIVFKEICLSTLVGAVEYAKYPTAEGVRPLPPSRLSWI